MDPKLLEERVTSLSDKVKMHSAVSLAVGTITVSIVIAILAMFFITTVQLSTLNGSVVALDTRIGSLETKVDQEITELRASVVALETKVDGEITGLRDLLIK